MRTGQLASALLLAASASYASPVRQHPIVHKEDAKPYTPDNRDPYDRKIDTWKEGIQPLPIVSPNAFDQLRVGLTLSPAKRPGRRHARAPEQGP